MGQHTDATAIRIQNKYVALHAARIQAGGEIQLPDAPFLHLFVAEGKVALEGVGLLEKGDAVRLTATGGQKVSSPEGAEILVWEMHATIAGW
ncbi:pirin family protein [Streptomyces sp. NPDC002206]